MKDFVVAASGVLSVVLAVWAGIPYIRSILDGRTKPHQMTWLVFAIMNGVIVISQYLKGGRASVLISVVYFIYSSIEFLLALRYGVRDTSRWDRLLFALSLLTIVAWAFTKNPSVAIWLTVAIDIFATTMMILKIKKHPGTEAGWPWLIATTGYLFSVASLADKPLGILYVRPLYGVLSDVAVLAAIYFYKPASRRPAETDLPPAK